MADWSDEQKAAMAAAPTVKLNPNPDGRADTAATSAARNNTMLSKDAGSK